MDIAKNSRRDHYSKTFVRYSKTEIWNNNVPSYCLCFKVYEHLSFLNNIGVKCVLS